MIKILNKKLFKELPSAVLMDLDNTLYPYEHSHDAGIKALRLKVNREMNISFSDFDVGYLEAKREVKSRLAGTAASHSRLLYAQSFIEGLGLGSQPLSALELEQTYWRSYLNASSLFPNVRDFLDDLRLLGIPILIVTDLTAQIQFRKIIYFDLDNSFDCIVTSEEAGRDKPSQEPYNLALSKLGSNVSNIWMIGDNPLNDIYGARAAINAVCIQKLHAGVQLGVGNESPDAHFEYFSEIQDLLKKLKG